MYAKFANRYCGSHYGRYRTLDEATFACSGDKNCEKVADNGCIGQIFYLCSWNSTEHRSTSDCTYRKLGKHGNIFLMTSIL